MTRRLSIVMAYYRNAGMLARQYAHLAGLPADVRERLELVVVDDCSPAGEEAAPPAEPLGLALAMFRITEKVAWNWIAARNIGVARAAHGWLLLTDMDHMAPEATLRRLLDGPLGKSEVYRFGRVDAPDLTPYKPHPNSWCLTRAMYETIGGFDERFSGCYGSDYDFRDRARAAARAVTLLPEVLVRYPREVVADASTVDLARKNSIHSAGLPAARERIAREGGPPLRLSFPFVRTV